MWEGCSRSSVLLSAVEQPDGHAAAPHEKRNNAENHDETGRHEPDQETMAKIAEALGLAVAYFHATSDPLAKIILMVGRLPPKEQARISDLIERWIEKK